MTTDLSKPFPGKVTGAQSQDGAPVTWIAAYLPLTGDRWERRIFKTEEIRHIAATDDKSSKIILYDGTSFPVLMAANILWQKVIVPDFRSGGEPISLLSVTGAEVFPAPPPKPVEVVPKGPEIGDLVEGEGVYLGRYEPKDESDVSIGKIFNIYAAPEDLTQEKTSYDKSQATLATLKNWHGHDGANYGGAAQIINALSLGKYKGEWVIPPIEIVDHMALQKYKGVLLGTFNLSISYLSSTLNGSDSAYRRHLFNTYKTYDKMNGEYVVCRPVRLVEVKP